MITFLSITFFVIASIYASVGFGGGSGYTAVLALAGVAAAWIPVLSLSCNLIVAGGGAWRFRAAGHFRERLAAPLLLTSIPTAYLAGRIPIQPGLYLVLLAFCLLAAGLLLLFRSMQKDVVIRRCPLPASLGLGVGLGALSGLVGIGGGIFLSPLLLLARWATPKESAALATVFILFNSAAGLAGQLSKAPALEGIWMVPPLALAVLLGGQLGSRLGAVILPEARLRQITACLVLLVSVRIFTGLVLP